MQTHSFYSRVLVSICLIFLCVLALSSAFWPRATQPVEAQTFAVADIPSLLEKAGLDVGNIPPSKPDADGDVDFQWHTFYGANRDYGQDIVIDPNDQSVYITGESYTTWNGPDGQLPLHASTGTNDLFIVKLSAQGEYQWHTFYGSTETDYSRGIVLDDNGDVLVTGISSAWDGPEGQSPLHANSGWHDALILKLSSSGEYVWHTFYGGGMGDTGEAIVIDGNGNLIITGESNASWSGPAGQAPLHIYDTDYETFILKLSATGAYQWHTFCGGSKEDYSYDLAVDLDGNINVSGISRASWNGPNDIAPLNPFAGTYDYDVFILKLSSAGVYQWHTFYGGSLDNDRGNGITVDGAANVYVTGYSGSSWNGPDGQSPLNAFDGGWALFVFKLAPDGSYQWHTFYSGDDLAYVVGHDIIVDSTESLLVVGQSDTAWDGPDGQLPLNAHAGGSQLEDITVIKLSVDGDYQWHAFYGGSLCDYGRGIASDVEGNIYITGNSMVTWDGPDGQSPLHAFDGSENTLIMKLTEEIHVPKKQKPPGAGN